MVIFVPVSGDEGQSLQEIAYELEHSVVDEGIVTIQFEGIEYQFNRLSEDIVENEEGVQYQFKLADEK